MIRRFTRSALACALAAGAALPAAAQGRPDLVAASLRERPHVAGELLVQFRRGVADAAKDESLRGLGARLDETVRAGDGGDLHLVKLPPGLAVAAAMRALERRPEVDFAEPNWVYSHQLASNDPYVTNGSLWGMQGGFGSNAVAAWGAGHTCAGSSVVVGVIDEGMMASHPDLAANAWVNGWEAANGVDDDDNGYADDLRGWDFAGNDNTTYDGSTDDHGTHVSGTIGGVGGNGAGVAGVCWSVKLVSAKFLGRNGGTTANAVKAVDYLTDLKARHGLNLVATNNSWGGGGYSQALADAIARAGAAQILFVAAAGNNGANNDATPNYPSNYALPNIIAVAAIDKNGALASFSNYGATTVHLGAPGVGIWSTVPTKKGAAGYASYSGTSMATPHVTGAAALYASTHPGASAAQIKAAILASVVATPSLAGKTTTGGRLNVSGF